MSPGPGLVSYTPSSGRGLCGGSVIGVIRDDCYGGWARQFGARGDYGMHKGLRSRARAADDRGETVAILGTRGNRDPAALALRQRSGK